MGKGGGEGGDGDKVWGGGGGVGDDWKNGGIGGVGVGIWGEVCVGVGWGE